MTDLLTYANKYKELGWSFYPQTLGTKEPWNMTNWKQWMERQPNETEINYLFTENNKNIAIITGAVSGNLVCIDIDDRVEKDTGVVLQEADETYAALIEKYPILTETATQKTNRGYHILVYVKNMPRNGEGFFEGHPVEIKGERLSFVATPSVHKSGHHYYWITAPWDKILTIDSLDEIGIKEPIKMEFLPDSNDSQNGLHPYVKKVLQDQIEKLRSASNGNRNNQLFSSAKQIYKYVKGGYLTKGEADSLIEQAAGAIGLKNEEEQRKTVETLKSAWKSSYPKSVPDRSFVSLSTKNIDLKFIGTCAKRGEKGDAELFAKLLENKFAYDPDEKQWYMWTGSYWDEDDSGYISHDFSNIVGAEYFKLLDKAKKEGNEKHEKQAEDKISGLNSISRVENSLKWARALMRNKEWNSNFDLLAFRNGTLNLRTAEFMDSDPTDYLRTYVPRMWKGLDEPAPKFEQYLLETQGGDEEMVEYLKRLIFVALLGRSNEAILPVFWGPGGRNGKSTLMRLMRDVFGTKIADIIPTEVLMKRVNYGGGPTPELYKLRGLRIAFCSETDGETLSPAKVKFSTGGDPIVCRDLNKGLVTFQPTHTIFLLTNPKPKVPEDSGDDEALWYRVKLIGWNQRFVDEPVLENEHPVNKDLDVELLEEASGIIASIVRAGQRYLEEGLTTPKKVEETTNEFRAESSVMTRWKEANCVIGPDYKTEKGRLYDNFYAWWRDNEKDDPMSKKAFGTLMAQRFEEKRTSDARYWIGIAVKADLPKPKQPDLFDVEETEGEF